jgi:hypothetical protein
MSGGRKSKRNPTEGARSGRGAGANRAVPAPPIPAAPVPVTSPAPILTAPPVAAAANPSSVAANWPAISAAAILLVAFGLRFLSLGTQPLQPDETERAWRALGVLRHGALGQSPALISLQALVFGLFGASDVTARLIPALAGTALVALPLALVAPLGMVGSRAAMLLLAISPSLVYYSRHDDPAILVATASVGLGAALVRCRGESRSAPYVVAALIGVLLALGPLGFAALAAGGALLLAYRVASPSGQSSRASAGDRPGGPFSLGVAVWLVLTTGAFSNLGGIQSGVVDGFAGWLNALFQAGPRSPRLLISALLVYELPLVLFAFPSLFRVGKGMGIARVAGLFALVSLVLGALSTGQGTSSLVLVIPPVALLAGGTIRRLSATLASSRARLDAGLVMLVGAILAIGTTVGVNHLSTPTPYVPATVLIVPFALIAGALTLLFTRLGSRRAFASLGVFVLVLTLAWTWREATTLSLGPHANPQDLQVGTATSSDVRTLAHDVRDIVDARARQGETASVIVASDMQWPILWYLRDVPGVVVRDLSGGVVGKPMVVIALAGGKAPSSAYTGQSYRILEGAAGTAPDWKASWRWLAYRELPFAPSIAQATAYVRAATDR